MKEKRLKDPWRCVMNNCSNIFSFPENSSRLINCQEEQKTSLCSLTLSPSYHPPVPAQRGLFLFLDQEKRSPSISFFLFYHFHFRLDREEQQQNINSEGGGWFIASLSLSLSVSAPLSSSVFLSLCQVFRKIKKTPQGGKEWGGGDEGRESTSQGELSFPERDPQLPWAPAVELLLEDHRAPHAPHFVPSRYSSNKAAWWL